MRRALLCDLLVNRSYLVRMAITGVFIAICFSLGTTIIPAVPGMIALTFMAGGTSSLGMVDDAHGWGAYRLTLPLSRRDVVVGRYLALFIFGLVGALVGALVCLAMLAINDSFAQGISSEQAMALAMATPALYLVGTVMCSVTMPFFFRLGATRFTQLLPMIFILIAVVPFVAAGILVPDNTQPLSAIEGAAAWLVSNTWAPWALGAGALAVSLALLAISAAISTHIYARRDL